MKQDSVAIIGASSSGLFTAYLLAREGVPVRVYEQAARVAAAPRTLIVTSELNRALGFVPVPAIVNTIHTFELYANGASARVPLREPDLIVDRQKLSEVLASYATEAGAELTCGHRFRGFKVENGRTVAVLTERGGGRSLTVEARSVVGADGARSQVALALGRERRATVVVMQARVPLPAGADPGVSQVWFAPRETPYFFWLVPESPSTAVVGLMHDTSDGVRASLDRFLAERGLVPTEYQAALIAAYQPGLAPSGRIGQTNVLMVGDAAGQVKVSTVGGTVTGFWGARAAARAIAGATDYRRELRTVDRELRLHWLIRRLLNRFGDTEYALLLRLANGRAGAFLERCNRDRVAESFWSAVAAQPRLLAKVARLRL